jgi:acetyl-CoA/propionyl-CoA carboxylase biotin carboxyl carrier protein
VDSGVEAGSVIGAQFDSLLAKVIVTGRDRPQALERARRALGEFDVAGVRTTLPFLRQVLTEPAFTAEGPAGFAVHTRWIEQDYLPAAPAGAEEPDTERVAVRVGRRWLSVDVPGLAQAREGPLVLAREQARDRLERAGQAAGDAVRAPMQGTVIRVEVADGDEVAAGQLLVVVEAMKMENPLRAPHPGRVTGLHVSVGDTVAQGATLCQVTPGQVTPGQVTPEGSA